MIQNEDINFLGMCTEVEGDEMDMFEVMYGNSFLTDQEISDLVDNINDRLPEFNI